MTAERRAIGRQGEILAAAHLARKGYGIIAKNWRCAAGEIDLIAVDGPTLVFVEVRARRSAVRGLAEESVSPVKQRRLALLADAYLQQLAADGMPWDGAWRIDVVALQIVGGTQPARIRHIRHAVIDM